MINVVGTTGDRWHREDNRGGNPMTKTKDRNDTHMSGRQARETKNRGRGDGLRNGSHGGRDGHLGDILDRGRENWGSWRHGRNDGKRNESRRGLNRGGRRQPCSWKCIKIDGTLQLNDCGRGGRVL
jgi:hypothetical protein